MHHQDQKRAGKSSDHQSGVESSTLLHQTDERGKRPQSFSKEKEQPSQSLAKGRTQRSEQYHNPGDSLLLRSTKKYNLHHATQDLEI